MVAAADAYTSASESAAGTSESDDPLGFFSGIAHRCRRGGLAAAVRLGYALPTR
jgi:hypothetical protein